jgi:tRNA 2-thiocytidine biosynthesis protein TtcA
MIRDGDRIAVAVSGGIDSLSLLALLRLRKKRVPQRYQLTAVHIRGDSRGSDCPAHPVLAQWLAEYEFDFTIEPLDLPPGEPLPLNCHRCTWNRRKTIFEIADRLDCNVVAFAHHADDFAQTTLLNLFYGGRLETMAPIADYFDGRFRLIRPLAFVPKKDLAYFGRAVDMPPAPPECPRANQSHRELAARALRLFRHDGHRVRMNLIRSALDNS